MNILAHLASILAPFSHSDREVLSQGRDITFGRRGRGAVAQNFCLGGAIHPELLLPRDRRQAYKHKDPSLPP